MTNITYDRDDLSVTAIGHSGYAESGADIVCSSISALMFALASYAVKLNDRGMLREAPTIRFDEGNAEVSVYVIGIYERQARMTFDSICSGFEWLGRNYKNNVKYMTIREGI